MCKVPTFSICSANVAALNAANAQRQHAVNRIALHYGASAGTAPLYGVPGTAVKGVHNDGYHGAYGYGRYGAYNGAYGYGRGVYDGTYGYGHHGVYNGYPGVYGYGFNYGHVY